MKYSRYEGLAVVTVALGLGASAMVLSPYHLRLGISVFLSAGMGVSWYILGGFASYYSFGHTAFVGIGAFGSALALAALRPVGWLLSLLLGTAAAMAACAILAIIVAPSVLRLRGHYFTIGMLAVALVCGEVSSAFPFFGGAIGLALPDISPPRIKPELFLYWLSLIALVVVLLVAIFISQSRFGYGLFAIRENEDAAKMLGVPTRRHKIVAFVLSGTLTGMMGALYAFNLAYINSESVFRATLSLDMIVNNLLGGMASVFGPVLGALVMTLITKVLLGGFLEYHLAITGILIILVVFLAPNGLLGLFADARRRLAARGVKRAG